MKKQKEAVAIVERLEQEYDRSVACLRENLKAFLEDWAKTGQSIL